METRSIWRLWENVLQLLKYYCTSQNILVCAIASWLHVHNRWQKPQQNGSDISQWNWGHYATWCSTLGVLCLENTKRLLFDLPSGCFEAVHINTLTNYCLEYCIKDTVYSMDIHNYTDQPKNESIEVTWLSSREWPHARTSHQIYVGFEHIKWWNALCLVVMNYWTDYFIQVRRRYKPIPIQFHSNVALGFG